MRPQSVVIVGGGITGLSAAWTLRDQNCAVTLIEPGPFGGLIRTERVDGMVVECGADSWIRSKAWLRNIAVEIGLEADIIEANEALRKTFIFRGGKLIPLPKGLRFMAPCEWGPLLRSPLLSAKAKIGMLKEWRRKPCVTGDRTVAEFVRDHFGEEAVEYLAEPLFAGIYGGSPETLGVAGVLPSMLEHERQYGSVIRGVRREARSVGPLFESMREGLSSIPDRIASLLGGRVTFVRTPADAVEPGRVRVGGEWMGADQVLLACGAPVASTLLPGTRLGEIPHSSATIYAFGFDRAAVGDAPRGTGFLVPRKERQVVMAGTWVTNKFSHRAPEGRVILRCFVAGNRSESLVPDVLADLRRITGLTAEPLFTRVYQWPESMPQYGVGHARLIEEIEASLPHGIHVAGAFLRGVGMPDCAKCGIHAARMMKA
jgi:oxygen-dependent protoporphyrinogen oxidase